MDDEVAVGLDQFLCFPLYAATRAVTRAYAELLGPSGLTYPQYLVVVALSEVEGECSVGDLGRRLRLDSGTLTPLLKRLEVAGLVARRRDPADERRVLVELTPRGGEVRGEVAEVPRALGEAMGLSWSEVVDLRSRLEALITRLDAAEASRAVSPSSVVDQD